MNEKATLSGTASEILSLLDSAAVGYHEDVLLSIESDTVEMYCGSPSNSSAAYVTDTGTDVTGESEAYLDVPQLSSYVSVLSNGPSSDMKIDLYGDEYKSLAQQARVVAVESGGEARLMLRDSKRVYEDVPTSITDRYDSGENLLNPDTGKPPAVTVETYFSELTQISEVTELQNIDFKPLSIKEESLVMAVGSERDERVEKSLTGTVDNPAGDSFRNAYGGSFDAVVASLSGECRMQLEEDSPVSIVQDGRDRTIRHIVATARQVV